MSTPEHLRRIQVAANLHNDAEASAVTGEWVYACTGCLANLGTHTSSQAVLDALDAHQLAEMSKA